MMTKAILDVDDCAEGMRKFTTELFDTAWPCWLTLACCSSTTGGWL